MGKRGRQPRLCPNVDQLRELVGAGTCVGRIAIVIGVSPKAIKRWLAEHNIASPKPIFVDLPGEVWKPVVGYEGCYDVSNIGRVRSLPRNGHRGVYVPGKMLNTYRNTKDPRSSYPMVYFQTGGREAPMKRLRVHILMLEAFVSPRPEGMEACHNDGNQGHNCISNLRWDTHVANMADQVKHGTHDLRIQRYRETRARGREHVKNLA